MINETKDKAPAVEQPSRHLLSWGLFIAAWALIQVPGSGDQPMSWLYRAVLLVFLAVGLGMVADWANRTAAWMRAR